MRKPEKPGNASFYKDLLIRILRDQASLCQIKTSFIQRDLDHIEERFTKEGLSFLTKTLPSLGKSLDKALASDCPFEPNAAFAGGSNLPKGTPKFLSAFFKLIFNGDGLCMDDKECNNVELQVNAVRAVRQVTYLFYKLEVASTEEVNNAVVSKFIATDATLPSVDEDVSLSDLAHAALDNAAIAILCVLKGFDPADILPSHGPGSVATGEKPWEKMKFSRFYRSLDEKYPYSDYFFFNYTHLCDDLESLENMVELDHAEAKVSLVPKDSRGPRLISMEPLELQWIQQGLFRGLVRSIEHPLSPSSGFVNFTYQDINRRLALLGSHPDCKEWVPDEHWILDPLSKPGERWPRFDRRVYSPSDLVTIDLEDASDRVSDWLVKRTFPAHVYSHMHACRSSHTRLPTGISLELKKFAPMGSACCFPVEALLFWALAVGTCQHLLGIRPSFSSLAAWRLPIFVYGDDIILPREFYADVAHVFEEVFLRLNKTKCCTGRFFRESCGCDAFKMNDVTPIRIKSLMATRLSPAAALAFTSYSNNLGARGCYLSRNFLEKAITENWAPVPFSNKVGGYPLSFVRNNWTNDEIRDGNSSFKRRFNRRYQREEIFTILVSPHVIKRGEPGWSELNRTRGRFGSDNDPFGFAERCSEACRFEVPRYLKSRGGWLAHHVLVD